MKIDKIIWIVFLSGILTLSSCGGSGQEEPGGTEIEMPEKADSDT